MKNLFQFLPTVTRLQEYPGHVSIVPMSTILGSKYVLCAIKLQSSQEKEALEVDTMRINQKANTKGSLEGITVLKTVIVTEGK